MRLWLIEYSIDDGKNWQLCKPHAIFTNPNSLVEKLWLKRKNHPKTQFRAVAYVREEESNG